MASSGTPRCIVLGCDGFFQTSQPGPYYLLRGRDHELLVDWLRACKYSEQDIERQISQASNNDVICASHFIGRQFRADVANQRIPSIFPWTQCGTSEENSREMEIVDAAETIVVRHVEPRQLIAFSSKPQDIPQRASNLSDTARRLSDLIATKRALLIDESPTHSSKKPKMAQPPVAEQPPPLVVKPATIANRCIVPECDGHFRGENTAPNFKPKYFTLPVKDDKLLQEWLLAIGLTPKSDLSAGKICCTHFKDSVFNSNDPLHRMPIVFAPRKQQSSNIPIQSAPSILVNDEQPKKGGLKPHMRPHFARKPVPEPSTMSTKPGPLSSKLKNSEVEKPQKQVVQVSDSESSEDSEATSDSENDSSENSSDDTSSDSSSSLEMVSAMPKLHSAAVASGMRGPKLSVVTPEQLCKMIMDNYVATRGSEAEGEPWQSLTECDLPASQSFGFEKFLFSLGLNVVRRRVFKTALAASARQEKRKNNSIVLAENMKTALTSAIEHFDNELAINRLDNFIKTSKLEKQQCVRCAFSTESPLVLDWHRRQPHFDRTKHGFVFCCMCPADQPSMKITLYREHLRYAHGCSFVAFDLFSQPYLCHYCTVCCATWQVLLSHMNNCRLTFNISENLRPDWKNDTTLAVNLTKPPQHMVIDRQLHSDNAVYRALLDGAIKLGLRQKPPNLDEPLSTNFVDLSGQYGLPPVDQKTVAPLGFDDQNQEFAAFFGYLSPPPEPLTRTTILQVPQSTAIVQIVQSTAPPPPLPVAPLPVLQSRMSYQPPKAPQLAAPPVARYSFAPPSELPSSFRPIRVAKLPEITMATIAAATAASRPPPTPTFSGSSALVKPNVIEPLNTAPPIRQAPSNSVIKRPEPPFTGANSVMPLAKRFRQTEFCLTTMQRLLFCELCRGIVQEREALRIHLFWAHRIGLPPSAMLTDEWYTASCPACGVGFYTPDGIDKHQAVGCYNDVFVPTFCVVCHKFLSTSSLLCAHLAREHGLTPPSMTRARVCFLCSSAFDTEEHCADHLRLGHQVTTEPNAEREDFINVIWQGQLVASVDPDAIGAEAAAAMLSLQAAAAFGAQGEEGSMLVEKMDDDGPAGGLGSIGEQGAGMSSANRALFFAARGGVAAPFRRGPGRPPLHGSRGRPRGSRARGPYRPRGTPRGPYRPRGFRLPGVRGPGRPPLTTSGARKSTAKRHAPRDASAAGKAQWFHEEYSLSETDDEDFDPGAMMLEPDEPEMEVYDEGGYENYDDDDEDYSPRMARSPRKPKYY